MHAALERSRLDAEARRANELRRSDSFKSLLLSSASHDLRTPLTAVKAAVSSLRDDSVAWSERDREAFLETIESQTDALSSTLGNLLQVSRLEGGEARAKSELIEVAPLLADAAIAAGSAHGHPIEQSACEGLWIRGDYGLLMQALSNLIENAGKYSPTGTPIRLESEAAPGRAMIRVANQGAPIDPEELPLLFDKFYRGRSAGSVKGTGLGLALVKAIVELAHGTASATSDASGTVITLSGPRAVPPA
jgi:two-component system sensor histidine kinase KdpD